ncbi:hypothetical protein WN944_012271 [Citrus x changshan-huyou]|uniref:Uncharacterized protein n=1 Tax=Citrus x changshan-huyou TaxID=2935761 RepID=A0AAP0N1E4_9ROSI
MEFKKLFDTQNIAALLPFVLRGIRFSVFSFLTARCQLLKCTQHLPYEKREELENLFPDMAIKLEGLTLGGNQCFVVIIALIILLLPTIWLDNLSLLWQLVTTSTSPPNSTDIHPIRIQSDLRFRLCSVLKEISHSDIFYAQDPSQPSSSKD